VRISWKNKVFVIINARCNHEDMIYMSKNIPSIMRLCLHWRHMGIFEVCLGSTIFWFTIYNWFTIQQLEERRKINEIVANIPIHLNYFQILLPASILQVYGTCMFHSKKFLKIQHNFRVIFVLANLISLLQSKYSVLIGGWYYINVVTTVPGIWQWNVSVSELHYIRFKLC